MKKLRAQAEKVRKAGASNVPGDSELIHATPGEKAILKMLGGSGEKDPTTGLTHYMNDNGGWGRSDSNGEGGGSDPGGGYGEGRDNSEGGNYGIDAGESSVGWSGSKAAKYALTGLKAGPFGAVVGGALGGFSRTPGSPEVNGGGWAGLGPSGQGNGDSAPGPRGNDRGDGWGSNGGNAIGLGGVLGGTPGATGGPNLQSPTGTTGTTFPSIYTDPVTGRLLSRSQGSAEANQQLLDQIMGTHVASTPGDPNNPLLSYLDSGLNERVANENLDNEVANAQKYGDDLNARRGLGQSTMQDATRASLGLSTAQARNQNKLTAQNDAYTKKMNLAAFLKGGQTTDNAMTMGLADLENQRKIAEITGNRQDTLAQKNLDYLNGIQSDNNRNAWINAAGNAAGSIDWSSLFG